MLKNPESGIGHKIFKDIVELMKMSQSDDQNDQMISKLENMVNEEEKNKNSEDGNSETTAAETAESEIENAEKQKMEGGEE